jgi:type II secretory pathway component PulC
VSERRDLAIAPLLTSAPAQVSLAWQRALSLPAQVLRFLQTLPVPRRNPEWRRGVTISRPLLALNVLMVGVSIFSCIHIGHALFAADVESRTGIVPPVPTPAVASESMLRNPRSSAGYDVIATRTIFDPNRAEPTSSETAHNPLPVPTLALAGVAISDDSQVAFILDLSTNHIAGYKPGDTLAGGRVERIESDRVVIVRADGPIEVRLHRPKDTVPVAAAPEEVSPRRARGRQE